MSFSTIRNMAGYVYISPKMNLWSDWWCFFAVSSQSFDIFTFNMLWLNGRSFFRSQKDLRLIYLWASEALEIWLVVMYLYYQNLICGVTGDFFVVYSQSFVVFTFNMLLLNGKPFLRSQKDLRLIYLWASVALEIWLVMYLYDQKWICGVTGDVSLLFQVKILLYSLLICYCLMENHFSEEKTSSDSFTYELQ